MKCTEYKCTCIWQMRMTWTGLHLENAAKTNSFIENQIALTSSINQHNVIQ